MNKILMIAACPFPGNRGTPSRILKMAEALKRAGNAVDILTYHNRDFEYKDKIINIFRTPKIPLIETNSPGPKIYKLLADFMLILKGLGLCKQKRYDLIHAHHIEGTICGLSLKGVYNIPVIYDAHIIVDDEVPTYKRYKFKPIKLFLNLLENICLNKSDGIVYVDKSIMSYFNNSQKNQVVIPTGTNIKEIEQMIKNSKNPFGKSSETKITYTGSISRYQNVADILKVAKLNRHNSIKFFIITGQLINECKELSDFIRKENLKNVVLIPNKNFREQIIYAAYSDILLSPRHFLGGLPQKITNYMVLKKKIVATKGSAKILDDSSAYLYKGGDIKAFNKKLQEAIKSKDSLKEENAFMKVKEFDWDNLAKKLTKFYYQIS